MPRCERKGVRIMTLRILGLAVVMSLMATSAQAAAGKCRTYMKVPISMALSSGKAFAVANNRVAFQPSWLRGQMGPHHYAYLPVWSRDCRKKVLQRRGRTVRR